MHAANLGIDVLVTVGGAADAIAEGARRTPGWAGVAVPTAGREQATDWLRHNVGARDVVLVKASRGAALEHLADALADGHGTPSTGPMNRKAELRADEGDPAGRWPRPVVLAARHPGGDPALHPARLRPGDPRRRSDQPPHQARHADHGRRRHHRVGGARLLPGRPDHADRAFGVGAAPAVPLRRDGHGRLPRRLHQDLQAALARPAQQGQDGRPDRDRPGLRLAGAVPHARGRSPRVAGLPRPLLHPRPGHRAAARGRDRR